jgi:hypothetical protein
MTAVQLLHHASLTSGRRTRFLATLLLGSGLVAHPLAAQPTPRWIPSSMSARAWLAHFEKMAKRGAGGDGADIVLHPGFYPRARVDSVIDGLERIALASGSQFVRGQAVAALSMAGSDDAPIPGVFERAINIYNRSDSHQVRGMIIGYMSHQRDRAKALSFLRSVAMEDPEQTDDLPFLAVNTLSEMGNGGRVTLVELLDNELLRDPKSIGFVKWFLGRR